MKVIDVKAGACEVNWVATRGGDVLLQAFHMDALLEVLPDLQPSGCRVEQISDDLFVDLQKAASAYEPHLLPFRLLHTAWHSQHHTIQGAGGDAWTAESCMLCCGSLRQYR